MENGTIDEDTHLVGAKVEEYLKSVDSAGRGLRRGGCGKLEFLGNGLLPLEDLVVKITNLFDV